jgi:dolichol-phosphate mannosyltransferase
MSAVVVLPTYNEAANIEAAVRKLLGSPVAPDILVVDDNSPDGTGRIVAGLAGRYPGRVSLLARTAKEGLGAAYRAGFAEALRRGYEVVIQMDADGSHPVSALPAMLAEIEAGADVVIGSRYVAGGEVSADWPWRRRLLSRGGNGYARSVLRLPLRDVTGGFKVWRAAQLAQIDLAAADASGYAFQIQTTLAARRRGATIREVPIRFVDRRYGESKMSRRIVGEATLAVLRIRFGSPAGATAPRVAALPARQLGTGEAA